MSNFLEEQIKTFDYYPDGTMKPEYREELHRDGWSEEEINSTEQRHIRGVLFEREVAECKRKMELHQAECKAKEQQRKQQRHQQISQMIQRSITLDKPFLVYAEGEEVCGDLELLYCIESNSLNLQETVWLVEFLLEILGDSPKNKKFYGGRLNTILHSGKVSPDKLQAIEEKVKQLNIILPPVSTYKSDPPINLSKASASEKRRFAMSGLDREELMSEGFMEADDF